MKCEQEVYDPADPAPNAMDRYKPCGKPASYVVDPFIAEIYDETQYRWLCPDCFDDRMDDI